ncbi:MAG: hypothetical protein CO167_07285 [Candidatus Marinimicrobia bacterium CG_4_9_14_3_um_filter_48_9]|nr:MAG: hypothetical protein CO167_07285 [Candidatus Marinimicrobia bacterium CG_4_9_14_3_um_filter_48_9]
MSKSITLKIISVTICTIVSTNVVFAESEEIKTDATKVGFGVMFHDLYQIVMYSGETPTFYVPIDFGTWKLEPFFSYYNSTSTQNDGDEYSTTVKNLGLGLFWKTNFIKTSIFYGVRVGTYSDIYSREYKNYPEDNYENSLKGTYVAPTVGGEYFFSNHFSLGGEISFERLISKQTSNNSPYYEPTELLTYNTNPHITLRYYF